MTASATEDLFTREARSLTNYDRAITAYFRFGMGPKPGGTAKLSSSPNAALNFCLAELNRPKVPLLTLGPEFSAEACGLGARDMESSGWYLFTELGYRHAKHMMPRVGFVERLVLFWANHFSLCRRKTAILRALQGHFERTVIRPNVLGSYADMLKAAVMHPAMLRYLENHRSTRRATNENLGREILELYTVGTASGYKQADVVALARMLTGWTFEPRTSDKCGQFKFDTNAHAEAPSYTLMNQQFSGTGMAKTLNALDWLAKHPSTSQRLAEKLLRHFGWDDPPPAEVMALAQTVATGTLKDVAVALLKNERLWVAPYRIRPPHLWAMAQARALGFNLTDFYVADQFEPSTETTKAEGPSGGRIEGHWLTRLSKLDNAPWERVTPDGYPDRSIHWLNPNAMRLRITIARQILTDAESRGRVLPDAQTLRQQVLPGSASPTDLSMVAAADKNKAALADIFLTSEFMIR